MLASPEWCSPMGSSRTRSTTDARRSLCDLPAAISPDSRSDAGRWPPLTIEWHGCGLHCTFLLDRLADGCARACVRFQVVSHALGRRHHRDGGCARESRAAGAGRRWRAGWRTGADRDAGPIPVRHRHAAASRPRHAWLAKGCGAPSSSSAASTALCWWTARSPPASAPTSPSRSTTASLTPRTASPPSATLGLRPRHRKRVRRSPTTPASSISRGVLVYGLGLSEARHSGAHGPSMQSPAGRRRPPDGRAARRARAVAEHDGGCNWCCPPACKCPLAAWMVG